VLAVAHDLSIGVQILVGLNVATQALASKTAGLTVAISAWHS